MFMCVRCVKFIIVKTVSAFSCYPQNWPLQYPRKLMDIFTCLYLEEKIAESLVSPPPERSAGGGSGAHSVLHWWCKKK